MKTEETSLEKSLDVLHTIVLKSKEEIERHPLVASGVALGLGFLIARLLFKEPAKKQWLLNGSVDVTGKLMLKPGNVKPVAKALKSSSTTLCIILPLAAVLIGLSSSGCGLSDISANIDKVKITAISLETADSEISIQVNNPSSIGLVLNNIDMNLFLADSPFIKVVKKGPVYISAKSHNIIMLPVTIRFDRAYNLYQKIKNKNDMPLAMDGVVTVNTGVGDIDLFFKISGEFPILRPPDISVASYHIRELDVRRTLFDVMLKIQDISGRNVAIRNLAYTIGFKHMNLVDKPAHEVALVQPGQASMINIPGEIDISAIRRSGLDEIVLEKIAQFKMRELASLGIAFGDSPTGLSRFARYAIDALTTANVGEEFGARIPLLLPSIEAVDMSIFLDLMKGNASPELPQPVAPVFLKASLFGNQWINVVVILIFFFGGLVLMWAKAPWKTGAKVTITVMFALVMGLVVTFLFFLVITGNQESDKPPVSDTTVKTEPVVAAVQTTPAEEAREQKILKETPPEPETPKPDFVKERMAACELYKRATNDIKRSGIYTDYFKKSLLTPYQLEGQAGVLKKMATSRGGGIVLLAIDTKFGVFGNNDMLQGGFIESRREIRKGSPLYSSITDLNEDGKVTFSGDLIMAEKEVTERESLCGDGWLIKFANIKATE